MSFSLFWKYYYLNITFIFPFDSLFLKSYLKSQTIFISLVRRQIYDVHIFMLVSTGIEYWNGSVVWIGETSVVFSSVDIKTYPEARL